jgi:polygalacturonase
MNARNCLLALMICLSLGVAASPARSPNAGPNGIYNIRDYGATGDGNHLDQNAINKAIDAASTAGGGTVLVPAGTYLCGSIHLQSHVHLVLDPGSVIIGTRGDSKAYDTAESFPGKAYQDGGHTFFHNSLIWGENLQDISITGTGIINGGGITQDDKEVNQGAIGIADKAIALKLCRGVLIRDITILHGGHFAILATGCDMVTLDNLLIDTNRDGIDVDCCNHTTIINCKVNSPNDDAICPKASYALNKPVPTENLAISNCQVSGYQEGTLYNGKCIPVNRAWANGRIKFGTESNGGFRNCVVSNCIFKYCKGFALEEVDGGILENIVVTGLVMDHVVEYPIYITLGSRNRGPKETTPMGIIRNVSISDVMATEVDSICAIQITGAPGYKISQIRLNNIRIQYKGGGSQEAAQREFPELGKRYPEASDLGINPAYGAFIRHASDITLRDVIFSTEHQDLRPALIADDVDGLQIIDCKAPVLNKQSLGRYHNVAALVVRYSPAFQ